MQNNFLELTRIDHTKNLVNFDNVASIRAHKPEGSGSILTMNSCQSDKSISIAVTESYETIKNMLVEVSRKKILV